MAWMYLTPILYTIDRIPENVRVFFNLNPMVPIILAYQQILYYKELPDMGTLLHAGTIGIVILIIGIFVFNRMQKKFVEEL